MLLLIFALYVGLALFAYFLSDSMIFLPHPSSYHDSADILKITAYLTDRAALPAWRMGRDAFLGENRPASTLLLVAGLSDPRFLIEVDLEAVA